MWKKKFHLIDKSRTKTTIRANQSQVKFKAHQKSKNQRQYQKYNKINKMTQASNMRNKLVKRQPIKSRKNNPKNKSLLPNPSKETTLQNFPKAIQ